MNSVTCHLLNELDNYLSYVKNPALCILDKWDIFLNSPRGITFKNQISQSKIKYKMFHK